MGQRRYPDDTWDKFFDFVYADEADSLPIAELRAALARMGCDMSSVRTAIRNALEAAKTRASVSHSEEITQAFGNCRSCRYWRFDPAFEPWGECILGRTIAGETAHETLARADDAESYSARLRTKPDFTCRQYGPKEGSKP